MVHDFRNWALAVYDTPLALATDLRHTTWTLSTGFQVGDLLLLNDSFTEDSICEYAVFRIPADKLPLAAGQDYDLLQIESLTTTWYRTAELLADDLQQMLDGKLGGAYGFNRLHVKWIGKGHE